MFMKQRIGAALCFSVVPRGVVYLRQVIGDGFAVLRVVLQTLQRRQRFVIPLQFVHAVRIVIRTAGGITAVAFAQLVEINRRPLVLLHHQIGVSAIERVVRLVGAGQRFDVDRFQDLQTLFIVSLLHLQHTLHEMHLVRERGVWVCLQIVLQVALQQLVPSVEPGSQSIVARLHLRRLGGEGNKDRFAQRQETKDYRYTDIPICRYVENFV